MKKIGVIGTGIMGNGIAANYLDKGSAVFAWNRTRDKLDPLVRKGAVAVGTPREAAEKADIVFEVTANDESSRGVWLGENGILAGARTDSVLVASATLSVQWTDELARQCEERGFTFFDMPMTGSRVGAESGKLVFLVGGDERKFDLLKEDLSPVSAEQLYFGKAGSGIRYKLLLNMLQAIHVAGLGEVLRIASKIGLDIKSVGDALAERPGGTATNIVWKGYQKEPDLVNFSVEWITKDLDYAKLLAEKLPLPLLNDVAAKFHEAIRKGFSDKDWTTVNKIENPF